MKWRSLVVALCFSISTYAQVTINEFQYWFDDGVQSMIVVPITPASTLTYTQSLSTNGLSAGLHLLNTRFKQSDGKYSVAVSKLFMKLPAGSGTTKQVNGYEYWFDNDYGNRVTQAVTTAVHYSSSFSINSSPLPVGVHTVQVRFKDNSNVWSATKSQLFIKTPASAQSGPNVITAYEYWMDDNYAGKVSQSVVGTASLQFTTSLNLNGLPQGLHAFHMRFKDSRGTWSIVKNQLFLKSPAYGGNSDSNVVSAFRYWIDTAVHQVTKVTLASPVKKANIVSTLAVAYLDTGKHYVYVQFQDTARNWSSVIVDSFRQLGIIPPDIVISLQDSVFCAGSTVSVHYTLNSTFLSGNTFTVQASNETGSFSAPVNIGSVTTNQPGIITATIPASMAAGTQYRLRIISSMPADTSAPDSTAITIKRVPEQAFTISGATASCTIVQNYTITPVQTGVQYTWQLSGNGALLAANTSASITWSAPGVSTIIATSSNSCGSGVADTLLVHVYNSAPVQVPTVVQSAGWLYASTGVGVPGFSHYQWYAGTAPIPGATDSSYHPVVNGVYTVAYVNPCGAGAQSVPANVIIPIAQNISFLPLANKTYGDAAFLLTATSSSSLPVLFTIVSGAAVLSADTLTITGAGTIVIQASQPGNAFYLAANPVVQSVVVAKAAQTISFNAIPDKVFGAPPFLLSATASTMLPVVYTIQSGYGTINTDTVHITGGGAVVVRATQAGNQNYLPAFADRNFCVSPSDSDTIIGFTTTCPSTQLYSVDSTPGINYTWSVNGGGMINVPSGHTTSITWTSLGMHSLTVSGGTSCSSVQATRSLAVSVANGAALPPPGNLFPSDSTVISAFPSPFSWSPSVGAVFYDVYIWQAGTPIPVMPVLSHLSQIGFGLQTMMLPNFAAGNWYNWKVEAYAACSQSSSIVRSFKIADLPDLVVTSLTATDTVFSGQNVAASFTIINSGNAATNGSWFDNIYLSADSVLDATDDLLGSTYFLTALSINQSYNRNFTFTLPQTIVGNRYIIARANAFGQMAEMHSDNNIYIRNIYIKQTPLPDLKVMSIASVPSTFSGQQANVFWTVENQGPANTTAAYWRDYIYLSADTIFSMATSVKIGEHEHFGILQHDSSYAVTAAFTIPNQVFGRYYVHAFTDALNNVYESAFENNNTRRSDSMIIYLTPPPDYTIINMNTPPVTTIGEVINVDWTVKNIAAIRLAKDSVWSDAIYYSTDSVFGNSAMLLTTAIPPLVLHPLCSTYALGVNGCRYTAPLMDADDVYYQTTQVTIPNTTVDSGYIFIRTDYQNQVFEFNNENNNTARKKITFAHPDLTITSAQAPTSVYAGGNATFSWNEKNNGPGKAIVQRTDRVVISTSPIYNASSVTSLANKVVPAVLNVGAVTALQASAIMPNLPPGAYYIFIIADIGNQVYEGVNENNNVSAAIPMQVLTAPADLHVTSLTLGTDTIRAGVRFAITYQVKNLGTGSILGTSWTDRIYISKLPVFNVSSSKLIDSIPVAVSLLPDSVYSIIDSAMVSQSILYNLVIDSAKSYVFVVADGRNNILESNENNNLGAPDSAYTIAGKRTDLTVIAASAPDSMQSGGLGSVSWSVKNIGGKTGAFAGHWYDGLYLSQDTVFGPNDIFVKEKAIYGPVDTNQVYNGSMGFVVPNGLSGYYHLLLVADHANNNADFNFANNYKVIKDLNGLPKPVYFTLTPPADLVVSNFIAPSTGYTGQPVRVKWKVSNLGVGITNANQWTESVYLSTDTTLSVSDVLVGSYLKMGALGIGAFYEDSTYVALPNNMPGNYYLLFKTDANNSVYEYTNENNNTRASLIYIIQPPPSDLIVTTVSIDTAAIAGDSVDVHWIVKNVGANPALGFMKQGIYLSSDAQLSNNDALLADPSFQVIIAPGDTLHHAARFRIKDISPGLYYAIVSTDLQNNIFEQNENNNTGTSVGMVRVTTKRLPIDTLQNDFLRNNLELYYRIEVSQSLAGETLLVTLKGDSVNGANELYLRLDSIPTRIKFDYAFGAPGGNQQVIIPVLNAGTYYLLAYGASSVAAVQQISLLAKVIPFSILDVQAHTGGNSGNVTVKITGAKFQANMKARLYQTGLGVITSSSIYLLNSTTAYATFNLAGQTVGVYNLKMVKPGQDSVALPNCFTITQGPGGTSGGWQNGGFFCRVTNAGVSQLLGIDVQAPSTTMVNRTFPMTIIYGNSGNVDIPLPTRMIVSEAGHPISFTLGGLSEGRTELFMEFREAGGPPGVLRPGAVGYITIFTNSNINNTLLFKLIE